MRSDLREHKEVSYILKTCKPDAATSSFFWLLRVLWLLEMDRPEGWIVRDIQEAIERIRNEAIHLREHENR